MAVTKVDEDVLLDRLGCVFCCHGYEGASLRLISEATGLKRASLYHRFPGGKEEMALAVMGRVDERFVNYVLAPLGEEGEVEARVRKMARRLGEFYGAGEKSCLLETMSLGGATEGIGDHVRAMTEVWLGAMAGVARESGASRAAARVLATEALVGIQGSLVLARVTGDRKAFKRVLGGLAGLLTGAGD